MANPGASNPSPDRRRTHEIAFASEPLPRGEGQGWGWFPNTPAETQALIQLLKVLVKVLVPLIHLQRFSQ
jgi:hypothetical protein